MEEWQIRREVRRLANAASVSDDPSEKRMIESFGRFYESLVDTSEGEPRANSRREGRRPRSLSASRLPDSTIWSGRRLSA